MTKTYIIAHYVLLKQAALKAIFLGLLVRFTDAWDGLHTYFFDEEYIEILSVLLIIDLLSGMVRHIKSGSFSAKLMLEKLTFKLFVTAMATISASAITRIIDDVGGVSYLVVTVKLTIALYLFLNIEKNICRMTDKKLCLRSVVGMAKNLIKPKA